MKPITKKVIEAGLVSKHTLMLMKRWGYLDVEATDVPDKGLGTLTANEIKMGFVKFVEELDTLLEEKDDQEIKETKFSIILKDPFMIGWENSPNATRVIVFKDESEQLIFPASEDPRLGDTFRVIDTDDLYEITAVCKLWSGPDVIAHQVEVRLCGSK